LNLQFSDVKFLNQNDLIVIWSYTCNIYPFFSKTKLKNQFCQLAQLTTCLISNCFSLSI